jgi:hypothetical protein
VRPIDFTAPSPMRNIVLATRAAFPRPAAVQAIVQAVAKLDLPIRVDAPEIATAA